MVIHRVCAYESNIDVSHEFLKLIRLRHVNYSGFDVALLAWGCSNLGRRFGRTVILEGWPTSPLAEHSPTNSSYPTSLWLVCSEHKTCVSGWPPQESLVLSGHIFSQGKCKPIRPWSTQHPFRSKGNNRARTSYGNCWKSVPCTSTAGRDKKALDRNVL